MSAGTPTSPSSNGCSPCSRRSCPKAPTPYSTATWDGNTSTTGGDNAATEQVFGHLKDEFYTGREFASYEEFKNELDAYIIHWNTRRRQIRLEGHTPEEFRNMSLTA